jgi:hypothetical protein
MKKVRRVKRRPATQQLLESLPRDMIEEIMNHLDIISYVRFTSTCRKLHTQYPFQKQFCHHDVFTLGDAVDQIAFSFENMNEFCAKVCDWLEGYQHVPDELYMPKSIFHRQLLQNMELRFTKNKKGRCTFIIQNVYCPSTIYQVIQLIYEEEYKRFRLCKLNNSSLPIYVPFMLIYIGCRVLFEFHGYKYMTSFESIDCDFDTASIEPWAKKLLCSRSFPGHLLDYILDEIVAL